MKTLQKYASMAFLLVSVATIFPAYANPTINKQEKIKQEETMVEVQKTETKKRNLCKFMVDMTLATSTIVLCSLCFAAGLRFVRINLIGSNFKR